MSRYRIALCLLVGLLLGLANPSTGEDAKKKSDKDCRHLYGVDWLKRIEPALAEAKGQKPARPVLVLQTLGDLEGFC